ncbi:MAG: hypothetical protein QF805_07460 [Pirellulaceae bacterium]|nr:hypothetical protein [Pirellulaceae bacterium]
MAKSNEATMNRRNEEDRRDAEDRRQQDVAVADDRRQGDRRKVQRRRQIDPTTCERDYTQDEIEFMHALDEYKRASGRMFPTCSEILEVIRGLGYAKINDPTASVSISAPEFTPEFEAEAEEEEKEFDGE